MRAKVTTHAQLGRKSLGCPAEVFAAVGASGDASNRFFLLRSETNWGRRGTYDADGAFRIGASRDACRFGGPIDTLHAIFQVSCISGREFARGECWGFSNLKAWFSSKAQEDEAGLQFVTLCDHSSLS
jgi:hypothetical protein